MINEDRVLNAALSGNWSSSLILGTICVCEDDANGIGIGTWGDISDVFIGRLTNAGVAEFRDIVGWGTSNWEE